MRVQATDQERGELTILEDDCQRKGTEKTSAQAPSSGDGKLDLTVCVDVRDDVDWKIRRHELLGPDRKMRRSVNVDAKAAGSRSGCRTHSSDGEDDGPVDKLVPLCWVALGEEVEWERSEGA